MHVHVGDGEVLDDATYTAANGKSFCVLMIAQRRAILRVLYVPVSAPVDGQIVLTICVDRTI